MSLGIFKAPAPKNETVRSYVPGSPERLELQKALEEARSKVIEIPQYIGSEEIFSGNRQKVTPPHDHQHVLGYFHQGSKEDVNKAIAAALKARKTWAKMPWEHRAAIFLKAADLIAGPYRAEINAATMLGQSKNAYQAEIDSACELIDFLRMNVNYMTEIYHQQPASSDGVWNRMEHRPLEGFVFAITPFNFTAIAGNLAAAPALMGNVVLWKPAFTQVYAAHVIMKVFRKAGLPDGVINMILIDGPEAGEIIFSHHEFAGIHFTGSTKVFQEIWKNIGENIAQYKSFPRIVGETGGKDFVLVHKSADPKAVATGLVRGAFEYQGQKCSAASRAYIPSNLWDEIRSLMLKDLDEMKMGGVEDFGNFINAVIDERSFDKITSYIARARESNDVEIVAGGTYSKDSGYFIEPTILLAHQADYVTLCEEIFGPVLTVYIYDENEFEQIIPVIDSTSPYALTGSIFSKDRAAILYASENLVNAAGNFYINDKPTGAVVGQQPFGGARGSGTNDKAGSMLNLLRWVSPRAIKETFVEAVDYKYPFLRSE
ncbi:L-glutamate gamma-semialdehyde dehydrogenase [Dyadobacter sandarakinus]|uniref:L-glutamate gamma-semialdehyde dehydrogenase n=1 Tax=Dyadobacter sandarakinus TaxID=2747268 RepID=A0ABX7ICI1_9BACT|nr:L-glutamate gamma-semialdehyde dehydrogenase [Dyadobacter sandarakinus]QRR02838.1 L-glutamate gamma-semialdehyde dehydrogenase [Dyadobacter sandarakinus]